MSLKDIFTFHNLYLAHLRCSFGKSGKKDVALFSLNSSYEIIKIVDEFKRNKYEVSPYKTFYVYEPKERRIDASAYRDRVVQDCFVRNYLAPLLAPRLIYDNAACQVGKGTDFARKRLRAFLYEAYRRYDTFYVLSFDVRHYFESIDHNILKQKLRKVVKEDDVYSFLNKVIDSYPVEGGEKGIPLGNQTSQWFALYYLDKLDRIIKEKHRMKYYSRYMDDGVVISDSKERLEALLGDLEKEMADLSLSFNAKKTRIYNVKQGITYLGFTYRVLPSGKIIAKMARKKKQRLLRYLKSYELDFDTVSSFYFYLLLRGDNKKLINKLGEKRKKLKPFKKEDALLMKLLKEGSSYELASAIVKSLRRKSRIEREERALLKGS